MFGGIKSKSLAMSFMALMLLFAAPVMAAPPKVGPLHGKQVESLRALGTPAGIASEELLDTTFPNSLEARGDIASALLEWQRVAHKAFGAEREMALANATRLSIALDRPQVANALLDELLTENPVSPYAQEALYHIATGADAMAAAQAFGTLQAQFPESEWTAAARLNDVWQEAETKGKVTNTYGIPQAETLKKRLNGQYAAEQQKVAIAGALGVVLPGVGHMYAGHIPQGVAVLVIWCLFTLAFLSACRHRHYAYAFLFVIPSAALWLTGPVVAMELARDQTKQKVEASLTKWNDLRPTLPTAE